MRSDADPTPDLDAARALLAEHDLGEQAEQALAAAVDAARAR